MDRSDSGKRRRESLAIIAKMVDDNDQASIDRHGRLRKDYDELKEKVESNYIYLRDRCELNTTNVEKLEVKQAAPVSFDKVFLSPRVWFAAGAWLLITVATVIIAILGTTAGIRTDLAAFKNGSAGESATIKSDVRDILTRMEAQKTADAARDKLRDVEAASLRADVTELKRLSQLQQLQLQQVQLQQISDKKAGK